MKKLIFLIIGAVVTIIFTANGSDNYKVVDGDSLEQGTVRIRLIGIDAPEFLQECQDKDGQSYRCGNKATEYLQSLMNGKIKCHHIDKDRYNRNLSECLNGENLNINRKKEREELVEKYNQAMREYPNLIDYLKANDIL